MLYLFKKFLYIFTFNVSLLLLLIIGIQNSSNKKKVDLILSETVNLPTGFIVGASFIIGSIVGNLLLLDLKKKN